VVDVIAEIGPNHDGVLDRALMLVDMAAEAGADAAKFQMYRAESLVHPDLPAMSHVMGYRTQIDRFRALEFMEDEWLLIIDKCKEAGIEFMASFFDIEMLNKWKSHVRRIKISSGDLTWIELLDAARGTGLPVMLSTGMATFHEIDQAMQWLDRKTTVMHCVSAYPCSDRDANLGVLDILKQKYANIGYSDHTLGITACLVAASKGVSVIEKHFTDDRSRAGGDHQHSADFDELRSLVREVKRIELMMGEEKPANSEYTHRKTMRRGAYAARDIPEGAMITGDDVIALRPEHRSRPQDVIGRMARKGIKAGEPIHD